MPLKEVNMNDENLLRIFEIIVLAYIFVTTIGCCSILYL